MNQQNKPSDCLACSYPVNPRDRIIVKRALRAGYIGQMHVSCWERMLHIHNYYTGRNQLAKIQAHSSD